MKIQEINTEAEFLSLQGPWQALEPHVKDLTIFQTWVFQFHCWRIFKDRVTPTVLLFKNQDDELLAIAPLGSRSEKTGPFSFNVLGFCCVKYCDFQNIIVRTGHQEAVMDAFAEWLDENRSRWDHIELRLVREDFILWQWRERLQSKSNDRLTFIEEGIAPFITIQPDWNDFQNALSGKRAKAIRYEIRNLFRQFEGEFKRYDAGEGLYKALRQFMDLHQKRIRQKYQLGAFPTQEIREGFTGLIKALEAYKYISIHTIESPGQTIAAIGTFEKDGVISYFQGGFDPDYQRISPGKVVLALRITSAVQNKDSEFDFLFGDEDYKFSWSTGQRHIHAIHIRTGSSKQAWYIRLGRLQSRMQESQRLRALYFKLTGK